MFGLPQIYFQLILVGVFLVSTIVGYLIIKNVPGLLHTPLMSGMNALSGITVLGALTATAFMFVASPVLSTIFGALAVALAMVNVVGGFMVTDRMLGMIVKKTPKTSTLIYGLAGLVIVGISVLIYFMTKGGSSAEYVYLGGAVALSVCVLVGIAMMSKVSISKIGNRVSAIAMLLAIIMTILYHNIGSVWSIYIGIALGAVFGVILAVKVKMIQMPQMVALLNGLGGAASALVGAFAMIGIGSGFDMFSKITSSLALLVGMVTLVGSLVAAGKLHKILPQKPIIYKRHQLFTMGSLFITLIGTVLYCILCTKGETLYVVGGIAIVTIFSSLFGYFFSIRVGGADMPITISLLNSFSGVAGAIAGLAINDLLLVAIGGIVGASGLLLTQIMCKAMNRSLMAILLGKTSVSSNAPAKKQTETKTEAPIAVDETNYAKKLLDAKDVIIVPGYGMAIAQAQHLVKKLADKLVANGTKVRYAVHPVAGRMPGHMNVLLCEANVEYEDLYEMEDINGDFATADATIVIGANDVLNPAAREAEGTPIYGMPVLSVDECKNIYIFNYDLKPGYAGVENPLYTRENGVHLYLGNAQDTLAKFIDDIDAEKTSSKPVAVEENFASKLLDAKDVIIVPGYGMAIAQAQHLVKKLADKLVANGTKVRYAVHPVAGRMPGHMNVLLCEANVEYEDLYEMEDINGDFATADATIVIGANDVLNPAAREAEGTPIYGMPVLSVDECKNIYIFNYDLKPGYAGVENPLYTRENGVHLYLGNAQETLAKFINDMDK